uniref:autotransporter assembly complex protein TamA n=1 Tax=Congregibacter sp. TaxID=2744308 RepID=UPI003F6D9F9E
MTSILRSTLLLVLVSLVFSTTASAEGLRYRIEGAAKEVRENVRAYLGEPPGEEGAVERFLSTAPLLAARALEALGYYEHQIDLQVDRSGDPWRATLNLVPGEPLRYTAVSVRLLGEGAGDGRLSGVVDSRAPEVGDPLHHGRYETLKRDLLQVARRRGYFDAAFTQNRVDLDVARHQATLSLIFDSGARYRFGSVNLDEMVIDRGLLERLLPFESGAPYEQRLLLELRQRLLRLGYFGSVTVLPDLPKRSFPGVPINVALTTAPRHSYEVGVGFSTDT